MDYIYTELDRSLILDTSLKIYYGYSEVIPTSLHFHKTSVDVPTNILTAAQTYTFTTPASSAKQYHLVLAYPKDIGKIEFYALDKIESGEVEITDTWSYDSTSVNNYYIFYSNNKVAGGLENTLKFTYKGRTK